MNLPQAVLDKLQGDRVNFVFAQDCDWDMQSPCNDCPFLKTSPFHQGIAGELPNYVEAIEELRFAHTCHKTDLRPSCDGPQTWEGTPKHCAGALMMVLKTGHGVDLQLPLLRAMEAGKFDVAEMTRRAKRDARVFRLDELLAFYQRGIKLRIDRVKERLARKKQKRARK